MPYLTKRFFVHSFLFTGFMLLTFFCSAQNQTDVLTNANVVSLFKAGISKSVIRTTIQNSNSNFDVSTNAILDMKKNGLPDDLIEAVVNKNANNSTPPASNSSADQSQNALEAGIYYDDATTGNKNQLEASIFSQSKSGSILLATVTYGIAKTKAKAALNGPQANFQVNNSNPVFFFVFAAGSNGSGDPIFNNAASPNEFLLIKFKTSKKTREVVTGSFGTYSGFSSGIDDENKVQYRFSKISPGYYKVYFQTPLQAGEYAFIYAGAGVDGGTGASTTSQKAFDFSVTR